MANNDLNRIRKSMIDPEFVQEVQDTTNKIGNLSELKTTNKTDIVKSVNEVTSQLADMVIQMSSFPIQLPEVDDTARLQRAIDYAGARKQKLLLTGTFLFSSTLNITYDGLKLLGEKNKTTLKYSGTRRALSFDQGGVTGTTNYGSSLSGVEIKDITFEANMTHTFDEYGRPTSWLDATCIYLNGARNQSVIEGCKFQGFNRAIHAVYNWMCNYKNNWFNICKEGLFLEDECNNVTISDNIFRRCGDIADYSGFACKIKGSYSIVAINNDIEGSNCLGFIYENSHAFTHIGGDIENNDTSHRKIRVIGREGADLLNRELWSYGGEIIGVRFRNNLGIEFYDGTRNIRVSACTFAKTDTKNSTYTIRTNGTKIENIEIGVNDYFGDNALYSHTVPMPMLFDKSTHLSNKYHVLESQELDVTNQSAFPIGHFPDKVKITKIQIFSNQSVSGSCTIDIGVGTNIASIILDAPFIGGDVTISPYGVKDISGYTANQLSGTVRTRIQDNTITSGKIRVRIFYEITG